MRITGAFVLALSLGVAAVGASTPTYAAKAKGKKKGGEGARRRPARRRSTS